MTGKVVTLQDLAEITGYAVQTLIRWQQNEGMPVLLSGQRGRGNEYDTEAVIRWLVGREVSKVQLETPRDRLDRVRADMIEMQLAEKCRQLAFIGDLEHAWRSAVASARVELLSLGESLESTARAKGIDIGEPGIRARIEGMLARLENIDSDDDPFDDDESPAAADDATDGEESDS